MAKRGRKPVSLEERFWRYVDRRGPDECWPWTGATNEHGYGVMRPTGQRTGPTVKAHRVAMLIAGHDIEGWDVLHTCDNPPCCNERHLFRGTKADNLADMHAKGRANHRASAALTDDEVRAIRHRVAAGELQRDLAAEYGVAKATMSMLVNGKTYAHI